MSTKDRGHWPPSCQFANCQNPSKVLTLQGRRCAYHLEQDRLNDRRRRRRDAKTS